MAYAEQRTLRLLALGLLVACGCSEVFDIEVKRRPTEATEKPPEVLGPPTLLARPAVAEGTGPGHLALSDTHVFWSERESRQVRKIDKQGGDATTLLTADPDSFPQQISVQGDAY